VFIPVDPTIRQVCILYDVKPHNHPVFPQSKVTYSVGELYRKCVQAAGVVGCTTRSVQIASSTKLILNGQTVSETHPSLINQRQQQKIINQEKSKKFPKGLGFDGVWHEYQKDLQRPTSERYIHRITTSDTGGRVIFTFVPALLALVHTANDFQGDGTFKLVSGEFDQYEITIWHEATSRILTIGRIYSDRKDKTTYKCVFDGFQDIVQLLTGQPLRFRALAKDGNLHGMGSDMELAELQAAGESFIRINEPVHSGLHSPTALDIMERISRICHVHCKRGVENLKSEVSEEDYRRLMEFMYLESEAEIKSFTEWYLIKCDQAWWDHKLQPFILSGIVHCRSKMSEQSWAITQSTTNMNEGQHSWTNRFVGTRKSLVEAILG
ncbi:hypothetical protein K435DRAFT_705395, partial [Dendrothele bispora CBS 962.96]